jgi:two-component system chemotaxis response regulator CheB
VVSQQEGRDRELGRTLRHSIDFDIVVLAGSAGGLDALTAVLSSLPSDFPIPVAVVLHRSTQGPNLLADSSADTRRSE